MTVLRDDTMTHLQRSPLFQSIGDERLAAMCERFAEGVFRPGHLVLQQGAPGLEFFLILEGTADVLVNGDVVATLGPDDFFGEVAALREGTHTASVQATSQMRCLYLPNGALHGFLLDHPELAVTLLHRVVRRLRSVVTSAEVAALPGG